MSRLKFIARVLFSAHVITLVFVGAMLYFLHSGIGTLLHARIYTLDSWLTICGFTLTVLFLGYVCGMELRDRRIRRMAIEVNVQREHAKYLRQLNAAMIDDVLMAARHGLPVKAFPYSSGMTMDA